MQLRSFYTFKWGWLEVFDKMIDKINVSAGERFSVWTPKDRNKQKLLIIYGTQFDQKDMGHYGFNELSETKFLTDYKSKMNNYWIHGYLEFKKCHNRGKKSELVV